MGSAASARVRRGPELFPLRASTKARLLDNVEDDMWIQLLPRPSEAPREAPRRVQRRRRTEVHPFLVPEVSDSEEELDEEQTPKESADEENEEETLPSSWSQIQRRKRSSNVPAEMLLDMSSVISSQSSV